MWQIGENSRKITEKKANIDKHEESVVYNSSNLKKLSPIFTDHNFQGIFLTDNCQHPS